MDFGPKSRWGGLAQGPTKAAPSLPEVDRRDRQGTDRADSHGQRDVVTWSLLHPLFLLLRDWSPSLLYEPPQSES